MINRTPHFVIRFYDSASAIVWEELANGNLVKLLPVEDISSDRRIALMTGVQQSYLAEPPYVFLHAGIAEDPTDGIVIWAVRTGPETALIHAVSSAPIAYTIAALALSLPVAAVYFVWQPRRFSLLRYHMRDFFTDPARYRWTCERC